MLEAAVPSIWASLHSWFTPTVLFLLLNLVIGTIAVTARSHSDGHHDHDHQHLPKLARAPSLVLDRLRSLNLHRHLPSAPPLEAVAPPPAARTEAIETLVAPPPDSRTENAGADEAGEEEHGHLGRSQSDAHPAAGEALEKLAGKIKKSASDKSAFAHFEAAEVAKRLEVRRGEGEEEGGAGEVDARADDFINRFRHQLKLQRLDSLMRYKEMLSRGK